MNKKSLFIGIVVTLIGLLLTIIPSQCESAIIILLGLEAIANGVYCLMFTRKLIPDSTFQYSVMIRAMFSVVIGLLAVILPMKISQGISLLLVVVGIYLLLGATLQMYAFGKLRNTEVDRKNFISEIVLSILVAFVLFIIAANKDGFLRILGIILILVGGFYLFLLYKNRPLIQEPVEVVDEVTGDISPSSN